MTGPGALEGAIREGETLRTAVVVDDEPITRMDLSQMLEELGFQVAGAAGDGFDAIELCRARHPDVVLMDIKMPVFDGLTAAETILSQELAGCVCLLTAFSSPELIERANRICVTGYLVKPVEQRLLLHAMEVALAQSRRLRQSRQETADALRQLEEQKLIERAKALMAREQGMGEGDAYRQLRQMAMDKRTTIAALARAVVEQHSQRELINRAKEALMRKKGISEPAAYRYLAEEARRSGRPMAEAARRVLD